MRFVVKEDAYYVCDGIDWKQKDFEQMDSAKSIYSLGDCVEGLEGFRRYVEKEDRIYECHENSWTLLKKTSSSSAESSSSEEMLSSDSEKSSSSDEAPSLTANEATTEYLNQEKLAAGEYGVLLDERDNKLYRIIQIGNQVWTAQNLDYEVEGSSCAENDDCSKVGRLYDWVQVMDFSSSYNEAEAYALINSPHQGICPSGYHVPTNSEWNELYDYVTEQSDVTAVTTELNAQIGWSNVNYDDVFGFSMIPMNAAGDGDGRASFWTSAEFIVPIDGLRITMTILFRRKHFPIRSLTLKIP